MIIFDIIAIIGDLNMIFLKNSYKPALFALLSLIFWVGSYYLIKRHPKKISFVSMFLSFWSMLTLVKISEY